MAEIRACSLNGQVGAGEERCMIFFGKIPMSLRAVTGIGRRFWVWETLLDRRSQVVREVNDGCGGHNKKKQQKIKGKGIFSNEDHRCPLHAHSHMP